MRYIAKVRTITTDRDNRRHITNAGTLHCEGLAHARAIQTALEMVETTDGRTKTTTRVN